jgi:hypothetical protein
MTLTDVQKSVDTTITGTTLNFTIANNKLASGSINTLLNNYWAGAITGVVIPVAGKNSVLTADHLVYMVNFNIKGFTLYRKTATITGKLDFSIVNNNVEMVLTVNPAATYVFADSFPILSNTPSLTLNQVVMTNSVINISSQTPGLLSFQASLVVNDFFSLVAFILGTAPALSGTIQLQQLNGQSYPVINVNTANLTPVTLGIFKLDLYLSLQSSIVNIFATQVALKTAFIANNFTLPVALPLYGPKQQLLSFNLDKQRTIPVISSLSSLDGFTGGSSQGMITVGLPMGGASFAIDNANVVFDLLSKQLLSTSIAVSFNLGWSIIPGVIELQKIGCAFSIAYPAQPKAANADVLLYANMVLGPVFLQTSVEMPSGILIARLQPGTTVNVNDMISAIAKGVTLPGSDQLIIDELDFTAQVTTRSYYFEAAAIGQLKIVNGLFIDNISFQIEYDNGALSDVALGCQLTFANSGVDLSLQAIYVQGNKWAFSGSTGNGQQIPIGHFIADLVALFGVDAGIPAWLNDATVSNISTSFNSASGDFNFGITTTIPFSNETLEVVLNIAITGTSKVLTGTMTIAGLEFDLVISSDKTVNAFIATFQQTGTSVSLKALVSDLSATLGNDIPDGLDVDMKDAKFVFLNQNGVKQFAIGVDLGASFDLSNLPIVGHELPASLSIGVNSLQVLYSSAAFTATQTGVVNALLPALPATTAQGVQVTGILSIGSLTYPISIGAGSSQASRSLTAATTSPSFKWFNIQKQFGPVQFQRIGVEFSNNILSFALDASIMLGPVTFSVEGLSFGSSISSFSPVFDLQGMGLSYIAPEISILGSILKIPASHLAPGVEFQYDGEVSVIAGTYGLTALASYAQLSSGMPSLFVFAELDATLGGPAFFIITGLMGGFGFNRSLQLPTFDEVQDFPLLAIGSTTDPMDVLAIMEGQKAGHTGKTIQWIEPEAGEYWLAAGLSFSSFEIVQGELLLVAEFGQDLAFAMVGLAWLRLPQSASDDDSYVYLELQMSAVLKPDDGYFCVGASLTNNSYVISKDCQLTGGFAFCFWFGTNPNAGQFVTTAGGYHPAFTPPSYYPQVPRLGYNWVVGNTVTIQGAAYFAITPSCGMAGGSLEILFNSGNLHAWFTAQADLMVTWHPFSFYADISIEIGVSYRLNLGICHKTISVSLGASMDLWGPPTGGTVKVHLNVVSFTVSFGANDPSSENNTALSWSGFKALLPVPADICKIAASTGVFKKLDTTWVARSGSFSFSTQSVVPAGAINVRPMNLTGVTSTHQLQIYYGSNLTDTSKWSITPVNSNMPEALWGQPLKDGNGNFVQSPTTPSANVVPNQFTGYTVVAPPPVPGSNSGLVSIDELLEEYILLPNGQTPQGPLSTGVKPNGDYVPVFKTTSVNDIATTISSSNARNSIFNLLQNNQLYTGSNSNMAVLAANAGSLFSDSPMER